MVYKCSENAEFFYQSPADDLKILNTTCKIRTRRRNKYYKYDYDPTVIKKKLEESLGEEAIHMFDFQKRNNCCYCVSITVYFTKVDKEYFESESVSSNVLSEDPNKYEYRYLLSILQTVKNTKMFLPEWIVRIYMDISIYRVLSVKKNSNLCLLFDEIFNSENVEIFTYECNVLNVERTRTYRFLPMIDETVAKVAIREADGYLCKMDCNNINVFSRMDAVMYLAEYFGNIPCTIDENDIVLSSLYDLKNDWIGIYKEAVEPYFEERTNIYSLVAGTITLNLKVKSDYFNSQFLNISNMILEMKASNEYDKRYYEKMDIGFDEMFLLHMFRDFVSVAKDFDEKEFYLLNNFIIGSLNYPTYKIAGNTINKCVENLAALVYDGYLEEVPYIDPNENETDFLKIVDSAVSLDTGIIFNIAFPKLEVFNPYGDLLFASLLSLLNIQYVYVESKINCVSKDNIYNYRKNHSTKDDCWKDGSDEPSLGHGDKGDLIQLLFDVNLYEKVYMSEKNYLDKYYETKFEEKKRKRST